MPSTVLKFCSGGIGSFIKRGILSGKQLPAIDEEILAAVAANQLETIRVKLYEGRDLKADDSDRCLSKHLIGEVKVDVCFGDIYYLKL